MVKQSQVPRKKELDIDGGCDILSHMNDELLPENETGEVDPSAPARIKFRPTLISKSNVRKFILEACKAQHRPQFVRVADEVYFDVEELIKRKLRDLVHRHPSRGKTITRG